MHRILYDDLALEWMDLTAEQHLVRFTKSPSPRKSKPDPEGGDSPPEEVGRPFLPFPFPFQVCFEVLSHATVFHQRPLKDPVAPQNDAIGDPLQISQNLFLSCSLRNRPGAICLSMTEVYVRSIHPTQDTLSLSLSSLRFFA